MTLLQESSAETFREGSTPVLETERLVLRAPRLEDVKAMVTLANDRRIAENLTRLPIPTRPLTHAPSSMPPTCPRARRHSPLRLAAIASSASVVSNCVPMALRSATGSA
jgi:hypothetical protein